MPVKVLADSVNATGTQTAHLVPDFAQTNWGTLDITIAGSSGSVTIEGSHEGQVFKTLAGPYTGNTIVGLNLTPWVRANVTVATAATIRATLDIPDRR